MQSALPLRSNYSPAIPGAGAQSGRDHLAIYADQLALKPGLQKYHAIIEAICQTWNNLIEVHLTNLFNFPEPPIISGALVISASWPAVSLSVTGRPCLSTTA